MGFDVTGIGSIADLAKGVIERIWPPQADPNKKLEVQMELQKLLEQRENTVIEAQRSIIVAEMGQGDAWTKRARPSIVYAGLLFIFAVHVAFPIITYITKHQLPQLALPSEFWWAWTGCCGIWMVGRTLETL